ncbi:GGDEF domain-containing protein [Nakamurella deserti]|uniref:GGDEF domain-containing protein n=1 Tax=Nakamurella deserti TaxID=2164074 RepID=UPI000DBE3E04|nr:GGDEF domain-containing protein [Nakamurella deserti]
MPHREAARTSRLVDVLVEFALLMTQDPPLTTVLQFLVDNATGVLPATAASVVMYPPEGTRPIVAASDFWALEQERRHAAREDSSDGNGSADDVAGRAGVPIRDGRSAVPSWIGLGDGLLTTSTVPLRHAETRLGALHLYRTESGVPGAFPVAAAQQLADVGAAYLMSTYRRLELQRVSELSRQEALHDPLTGLPNRTLMVERLRHACERSRRSGLAAAVLYIDLDGFKAVNDTLGHTAGDQLLVAVSTRLRSLLRPPDTLARLHGDEFVLMCEDLAEPAHAADIARRLQAVLDEPLAVGGTDVVLRASVGVVLTDAGTVDAHQVLVDADRAMYEAKRRGGAQFWFDDRRRG